MRSLRFPRGSFFKTFGRLQKESAKELACTGEGVFALVAVQAQGSPVGSRASGAKFECGSQTSLYYIPMQMYRGKTDLTKGATRMSLCFGHGCSGKRRQVEHGCCYGLGHACSGNCRQVEHGCYYGLGMHALVTTGKSNKDVIMVWTMDALVNAGKSNMDVIMVWAWMLW